MTSEQACQQVAEQCRTAVLMMSGGKDAVASWIQLRRYFDRVVPVYCYLVPGLQFVEDYLRYLEDHFGERILRYPHPRLYELLRCDALQPPGRRGLCQALPDFEFADVQDCARDDAGCPAAWAAMGVRAADSPMRRIAFARYGAARAKQRVFYPVWDWCKVDLLDAIRSEGVKLAPDYRVFGRSFDGLDHRFLGPMSRAWPADYERVREWFPMADVILRREGYCGAQTS